MEESIEVKFLHCSSCGKQVSTGFYPIPTATPDRGLIVRAFIECPECIESKWRKSKRQNVTRRRRKHVHNGVATSPV